MRSQFLMALLLTVAGAGTLWAQQAATLKGLVTDSTAAVIPGAGVTLVNPATGETYTTSSSEGGEYTIPFIKPGAYDLRVEAEGFKQFLRRGLDLDTGGSARIDVALEPGS